MREKRAPKSCVFDRRFRSGRIAATTGKAVDVLKKILKFNR
jgi:hypothetical protein